MDPGELRAHAQQIEHLGKLTSIVEEHARAGKYGKPASDEENLEGGPITDLATLIHHTKAMCR